MDWMQWPGRDPHRLGGYLYLLGLSSGSVKIGSTRNPRERADYHRRIAAVYGITLGDGWLSPRHANYRDTEQQLIARLPIIGKCHTAETVMATLSAVVAVAEQLDFESDGTERETTPIALLRAQRYEEIRRLYDRKQSIREVARALGVSKSLVANVVRAD